MQPAQNPAQSHSVQNSRLPSIVIALLIFGALKGWPLVFAQAQQLVIPPTVAASVVTQKTQDEVAKDKKAISFDEKCKGWALIMLIYDIRVTVRADWSYEIHVHRKALVQTKDGSALGESPIFYDSDTEEIKILRAVTITPDGKEHPPVKIQELSVYGDGMYSNAKQKVLSMPEVTPGSVIDLEYVKTTKHLPMPGAFWYIQYAEHPFPVKDQRIIFRLPENAGIQFKSFLETWKPAIRKEAGDMVYLWERREYAPDMEPEEEYLPPPTIETVDDGLEFSSVKSWQDVAKWFDGLAQKNLRITPEIRKAAEAVTKNKKTVREKTRAILEYLRENFRYVSMSFDNFAMEPHPTDEVFRNKYGDCKDQSLLVKAMLNASGVRADLCLFSREEEGNDPQEDLPLPDLYDHVLLKVYDPEKGDFYADALLDGFDIEEYPMDYQGAYLFVITAEGGRFERMPLFEEGKLAESITTRIEIRPDGSSTDDVQRWWDLPESINFRERIRAMSAEGKNKFFEYLNDQLAEGGKVLELTWDGLDTKYGRIKTRVKSDRPDQYPVKDGLIVIDLPSSSRPDGWSLKERKNPIFLPVNGIRRQRVTFRIPEGFEVMHFPQGIDLDNGFFAMKRDIKRNGQEITVSEVKTMKRITLPATDYPKIKSFYDKLPALTEQRIILKRKG